MIDGLWDIAFSGAQGSDWGALVLIAGRILGRDPVHTFDGSYHSEGDAVLQGKVKVHPVSSGPNVMGIRGDYELEFSGTVQPGNTIKATATVVGDPTKKLTATLTKRLDYSQEPKAAGKA